ncbi:MAG: hypothetical protein JSS27_18470 [Planctomycetes bacterium]|nr:hypothetical protein [Planctomycetota bacterium]
MTKSDAATSSAFGFLTVVEHEQHGFFGGYLLLNGTGRPIEFHCTAPLRPNRAQEILYGPTLVPYLFGELIGQTLVQQAGKRAVVICTDQANVLALQEFVDAPVLLVEALADGQGQASSGEMLRIDGAHAQRGLRRPFALGGYQVALAPQRTDDEAHIRVALEPLLERVDLAEPFTRIREALDEAQRGQR